ncbi:hypothetical protein MAR_014298 [Mya arenaria]|uniref:Uncharacterized protein n=1 Tax=Mya arenaria TaxID=6604 RepID=A0ABY7G5K6_MYAAR|nr:hypothetical protein MAR_014298 [Mya arenaria]
MTIGSGDFWRPQNSHPELTCTRTMTAWSSLDWTIWIGDLMKRTLF